MKTNELPGKRAAFHLESGEGERFSFGRFLATVIARPIDTGDLMAGCILTGGQGASFPLHRHAQSHEAIFVIEGAASLVLDSETFLLSAGDYVNIPPGVSHGFTFLDHRARLMLWTFHGNANQVYGSVGTPNESDAYDETGGTPEWDRIPSSTDIEMLNDEMPTRASSLKHKLAPANVEPYVLLAGEGERMLAADQIYTFLGDQRQSNGSFIVLMTEGPKGPPIPPHFHEKHTETFFCLNGALKMFAGDQEVILRPGDFLHIPAGTVHSFQLIANNTRFLGVLAPGLFEPFFRYLCDPFDGHIYPRVPPPFRFDRVMQYIVELDLKLMGGAGRPPQAPGS